MLDYCFGRVEKLSDKVGKQIEHVMRNAFGGENDPDLNVRKI